jgi:hypothetical protein
MPIARATLGQAVNNGGRTYYGAPFVNAGFLVDQDDCLASACGTEIDPTAASVCNYNGFAFGSRRGSASCAPAAPAPAPQVVMVQAPAAPPAGSNLVPPEQQAKPDTTPAAAAVGVTVESAAGPVAVSSDLVPGYTDQALVPVQVRIPNIWDLLDPSAVSQFEYRGLSTALPVWISQQYRRQQAAAIAPATTAPADGSIAGIPWWVWLAIGGTAYAMSGKPARKARAPRVRK